MPVPKENDDRLTATPQTGEVGWSAYSFFANHSGPIEPFNPDILLRNRGFDIYRRMRRDPQVKAVYNLVTDIILSRAWSFKRVDNSAKQKELEEFLTYNLERFVRGTFLDGMRFILSSKAQGYSVTEKIWQADKWRGKTRWFLRSLKPKPYQTFRFQIDQFGNLKKLIQDRSGTINKLDPAKFIIHVSNPDMDDVYGESDLKAAYRPYWEKDIITKMWDIFLERMAAGFLIAKSEKPLQVAERDKLQKMLENVSALTGMMLPPGTDMQMVNATPTDAFERAIFNKNTEIAKALLVPNLLGLSEQGRVGSNAQATVQMEVFFLAILRQGDALAETINEQIVRQLAWWNFGETEPPRFEFDPFTDQQKNKAVESWVSAVDKGVVVNTFRDELHTRHLLGYGEREEDEKPVVTPEEPKPDARGPEDRDSPDDDQSITATVQFQESDEMPDLSALEANLDGIEQKSANTIADALDQAADAMIDHIREVYPSLDKDNEDAITPIVESIGKSITPNMRGKINKGWQSHMRASYRSGRKFSLEAIQQAAKEAGDKSVTKATRRVARETGLALSGQEPRPINPQDFVDGLDVVTAEEYFKSRAFWITGNQVEDIIASGQKAILDGLRDELSLDEMLVRLEPILAPLIGDHDAAGNRINIGARLETIIRTNLTDAFTQAQLSVYNDPDLEDFVPALKYSAIIDSRTTQFCREHNGRTYLRTDPIWTNITPPNHFNCRSVLIPVTQGQAFNVSNKLSIKPATGFGG